MPNQTPQQQFERIMSIAIPRLQGELAALDLKSEALQATPNQFHAEWIELLNASGSGQFENKVYCPGTAHMFSGIETLADEDKEKALNALAAFLYSLTELLGNSPSMLELITVFEKNIPPPNLNPGYLIHRFRMTHRRLAFENGAFDFATVPAINDAYSKLPDETNSDLESEWTDAVTTHLLSKPDVDKKLEKTKSLVMKASDKAALLAELYAAHYTHLKSNKLVSQAEFQGFMNATLGSFKLSNGERKRFYTALNESLSATYRKNSLTNIDNAAMQQDWSGVGDMGQFDDADQQALAKLLQDVKTGRCSSEQLEANLKAYAENKNPTEAQRLERLYIAAAPVRWDAKSRLDHLIPGGLAELVTRFPLPVRTRTLCRDAHAKIAEPQPRNVRMG